MLKYRLLFGTLMTFFFTALVVFDGWLDGSLTLSLADDSPVQGTILFVFISALLIPAHLEFNWLAGRRKLKVFLPVSIICSIFLAGSWYWPQLVVVIRPELCVFFVFAGSLSALFLSQYFYNGVSGVIANCGASLFAIIYLGLLSGFVLAIRIDFGLWALLMFVFVVKAADIGAYTAGRLFGRRKFSPVISPGKTWEGMFGAGLAAVPVAVGFAAVSGIMSHWQGVIFGVCLAFIGQFGDLAESMIKRDAEQKDSFGPEYTAIPGFGGILDVVDSPLGAAPFGYLFFMLTTVR